MPFENGVFWRPIQPHLRGRHATFGSAVGAALEKMLVEHDDFFDAVVAAWPRVGAGLAMRPGRFADGKIFLYVKSAPALFAMRAKLPALKRTLAALPGAPKKIELRLEIHAPPDGSFVV